MRACARCWRTGESRLTASANNTGRDQRSRPVHIGYENGPRAAPGSHVDGLASFERHERRLAGTMDQQQRRTVSGLQRCTKGLRALDGLAVHLLDHIAALE